MLRPRYGSVFRLGAILALISANLLCGQTAQPDPARWEPAMRDFEAGEKAKPTASGGIVFIGSSSIRLWDLEKYFPGLPVTNRGFGGSQIADSTHYADRILLPLEPRIVVLYAGDNDVNAGKTTDQVVLDYRAFVAKVHATLPRTRIVFIALKPSLTRWRLVGSMRKVNKAIGAVTAEDSRLIFVDIDPLMIGVDGRPRRQLFVEDGLHLSAEGYQLWTSLVLPHL
jgi:lysophospholipase L1-like esterase